MYTLYVIPGSHACRSAMLMLERKGVPYRTVEFVTLTHPLAARVCGFDAGGQTRSAAGRRTATIRLGDLLATVPGLKADDAKVSTNYRIARFLDERHPDRPLLPGDPARRAEVEEAESWANQTLQMAARRVLLPYAGRNAAQFSRESGNGRLGPLLYHSATLRRLTVPIIARTFAATPTSDAETMASLPALLDRVDAYVAAGVLGSDESNAADCMVAPSLALMLYRPDARPVFEGRPALALVDRLLPQP